MTPPTTTENQLKILRVLQNGAGEQYFYFRHIEKETGLSRNQIKAELIGLKELGLVEYAKGLINEDGEVAGSGYGIAYQKINEVEDILASTSRSPTTQTGMEKRFDERFIAVKKYNGADKPAELANHLCLELGLPDKIKSFIRSEITKAVEAERARNKIDHTIDVRYEENIIEAFNKFIKKWCGDYYPHLIDDDENDGEFMRDKIRELTTLTKEEK